MSDAAPLVAPWVLMALAAAHSVRVMARLHVGGVACWIACAVAVVVITAAVAALSEWIAAVTTFLALAGLVPFGVTWGTSIAAFSEGRCSGRAARACLAICCALVPLAWLAVIGGAILCGVAAYLGDRFWIVGGSAASIGALAFVTGILIITWRARRRARQVLSEALRASDRETGKT